MFRAMISKHVSVSSVTLILKLSHIYIFNSFSCTMTFFFLPQCGLNQTFALRQKDVIFTLFVSTTCDLCFRVSSHGIVRCYQSIILQPQFSTAGWAHCQHSLTKVPYFRRITCCISAFCGGLLITWVEGFTPTLSELALKQKTASSSSFSMILYAVRWL